MQLILLHFTTCDGERAGPTAVLVVKLIFWACIHYDRLLGFALHRMRKFCMSANRRHIAMVMPTNDNQSDLQLFASS